MNDADLEDGAGAAEVCAQAVRMPFLIGDEAEAREGAPVRLLPGQPIVVMAARGQIGTVDEPIATMMRGCLELGYSMTGSVVSVDGSRGELVVSGKPIE